MSIRKIYLVHEKSREDYFSFIGTAEDIEEFKSNPKNEIEVVYPESELKEVYVDFICTPEPCNHVRVISKQKKKARDWSVMILLGSILLFAFYGFFTFISKLGNY
jgi:hypothetical protein